MQTALTVLAAALGAALVALVAVAVVHRIARRLGRRTVVFRELTEHAHRPFRLAVTVLAVNLAVRFTLRRLPDPPRLDGLLHLLVLVVIGATAWLVAALLLAAEDSALSRFRTDVPDNRHARRIHTQVVLLRRVTVAVIVVITIGVMLMTFPSVRGVGASLLASAGVVGVVAALAAQSLLGNVIAGLQLAFSDAMRLDDVVVVEGEWGRIEELTLSYVVVHLWDDRRLILPPSYFTTRPFQNWTRTRAAVLGTAEFDVDWRVPVQAMREELRRFVEGTELWDGRVCVLQVTDATGGMIRLRALVSALDAPTLFDLRCAVREHLVEWVREHGATALPRVRAELGDATGDPDWQGRRAGRGRAWHPTRRGRERPAAGGGMSDDARLFGGDDDGTARGEAFAGPEEPVDAAR